MREKEERYFRAGQFLDRIYRLLRASFAKTKQRLARTSIRVRGGIQKEGAIVKSLLSSRLLAHDTFNERATSLPNFSLDAREVVLYTAREKHRGEWEAGFIVTLHGYTTV